MQLESVDVPAPGAPVLTAPQGRGPAMASGSGTRGFPLGTGTTNGAGSTAGGAMAGARDGGDSGGGASATYQNWVHVSFAHRGFLDLVTRNVDLDRSPEPTTWEDLCTLTGIDPTTLQSQPHVSPYLKRLVYAVPRRELMKTIIGMRGTVKLRATVELSGKAHAEVLTSSGTSVLDEVAVCTIETSHWLPALDHGAPVIDGIELDMRFSDVAEGPTGHALTARGQREGAQGAVITPAGDGQAPVSVPGGAGQRPGSW
ncbi:MAG: hypothetical protein EB084_15460 [Proteobacteria bacterium]|nr:hypothetical protein [Pseudomonadota bacterium]